MANTISAYCDACGREFLLGFSCTRRGLCPSCAAKRGALFGAFLREEVLEEVDHCLWTFTIPKLLRPFYLHRRELLGSLCRATWETVSELVAEAAGEDVRPGMVAALHSASADLRWHPHVHALTSRGGWDREGFWHPVAYVDERAGELLFRQKVITQLVGEGLLGPERLELLNAWKSGHTGFSAHNRVTVAPGDGEGLERLARYLLRAPLSLERLELDGSVVHYRHKRATKRTGEAFDAQDFVAQLLQHIPAPKLHLVRYYGHYANAARAKRRRSVGEAPPPEGVESARGEAMPSAAERKRLRRGWALLIRRVYEVDPLLCPCGEKMRILSFLTDPPVVSKILRHLESQSAERPRGPPREGPEPAALAS